MSKLRVHELAKVHEVQSKEILNVLKKLNYPVNNHMSTVEEEIIIKVEEYFNSLKTGKVIKKADVKPILSDSKNKKVEEQINKSGDKIELKVDTNKLSEKQSQKKVLDKDEFEVDMTDLPVGIDIQNSKIKLKDDLVDKKRTKISKPKYNDNKNTNYKEVQKNNLDKNKGNTKFKDEGKHLEKKIPSKIIYTGFLTVGELAKLLCLETSEIIKKLMSLGIMATINQELEIDVIKIVAEEYGVETEERIQIDESQFELIEDIDHEEDLIERAPIVTIMGHVDHGKTTLLDAIRNSKITAGEAGGITQHIGAYQVESKNKKITFLDTPGHAAFTSMRARGAQVTDITILVVAADDGVMPQTVEAINHAKAANVPIIVAINKIDKPNINIDRIKQELSEHGLLSEDWGGSTIFVPVSALRNQGLDNLLEMLLLLAEVEEYKANPKRLARGTIIESQLDKGRGVVATVLIQNGTLNIGDPVVAGTTYGRVRAMVNDKGKRIKEAGPSTPVEITGLNEVPQAGDQFIAFSEERKARTISEKRAQKLRQEELNVTSRVTLDDLFKQIQEGEIKELNVIIKGDVQGSVEALQGSLEKIDIAGVRVKTIHKGVGAITETDVTLASASNAIIIGFNVRPEPQARISAENEKVDIRLHRIIYKVIEEIDAALRGMLDPEYEEIVIGRAEVRQIFKASNIGIIAGCFVIDGKIQRNAKARIIRDSVIIFDSNIESLKRFKEDTKEVAQGYECGITVERFTDIKEGDIIEAYKMDVVKS
ncbi:MAG: translation initiation factor IF-2 [Vulcanibacillus sp.]